MENFEKDFSIFNNKKIYYLDSAATSQKPDVVIERVKEYYSRYNANPHRGAYDLSIEATTELDNARSNVQKFINAKYVDEVIFTKNATEAFNIIAFSYGLDTLKKGDEIVLSIMEHHSNLVPWQIIAKKTGAVLKYMYVNEKLEITKEEVERKITEKTKIVAITHISNVTGTINDIEYVTNYAHKYNAKVIIDATQSICHKKVDVQKIDADFLVFSGHKMFAEMGVGVLYAKKTILENMNPFIFGGNMIEYVYEQDVTFADIPNRFEGGTQNLGAIVSLDEAIKYIKNIGIENIDKYEQELLEYTKEKLSKLNYVKTYIPNKENHSSIISFNVENVHPHDVASILNNYFVAIRAGNHCAQPYLRYLKLDSTCRLSLSIYNKKEDIDALVIALEKAYNMFKKYMK